MQMLLPLPPLLLDWMLQLDSVILNFINHAKTFQFLRMLLL
jgi:hypothetical protein